MAKPLMPTQLGGWVGGVGQLTKDQLAPVAPVDGLGTTATTLPLMVLVKVGDKLPLVTKASSALSRASPAVVLVAATKAG